MSNRRHLHLCVNVINAGIFGAAWRAPESDPFAFADVRHYVRIGQIAERGLIDAVFLADGPSLTDGPGCRAFQSLEPTIVLAAIAAATEKIGLVATLSSSYNEPYNIARRIGTLDLASGGRAGWNVVTSAKRAQALNFGFRDVLPHDIRYERAREFVEIVKSLWDSWEDDAFVGDKATGRFVDMTRVHAINYVGRYLSVAGPLQLPRSPQGRPVVFQAGGSGAGRDLAALHADAVFTLGQTIEEGVSYATDLRARLKQFARDPNDVVILPGVVTVIGSTSSEARRRQEELRDLLSTDFGLSRLAGLLGVDPACLKLDEPLPTDLNLSPDRNQTDLNGIVHMARRGNLTVRKLIREFGDGGAHRTIVGTPDAIADSLEAWFRSGAADGFNLMPDVLPQGLENFVDTVIPELQRRDLFRVHYRGRTLREHLGLPRPPSCYTFETT